jgi:nicotinamide-nucleotide amidase
MNDIRTGEILCIGTELLVGQIVNTNASWLANRLTLLGVSSYYQTVVGDNPERMFTAMSQAGSRSDLVVITGGLGPTADDLTMSVAAKLAGQDLKLHQPSRDAIEAVFKKMGRKDIASGIWKQAMLPEYATVLSNGNGTAPGVILELEHNGHNTVLILLPGPPSEMQPMFLDQVEPWLKERITTRLNHLFVRMIGIGESAAEAKLLDLIEKQGNPSIAPYASEGEVMFRITQLLEIGNSSADLSDKTGELLAEVQKRVGEFIYEIGSRRMPEVVKDLLTCQGKTISFAESCTAGMLTDMLASYPGASQVLSGSVIAYDNKIKINILNVPEDVLQTEGAVSEACAIAMAEGCRMLMGTDLAVSVTGIAGPEGGTPDKPVGLVYLAVSTDNGSAVRKLQLPGNRNRIRKVAALNALDLARRQLL